MNQQKNSPRRRRRVRHGSRHPVLCLSLPLTLFLALLFTCPLFSQPEKSEPAKAEISSIQPEKTSPSQSDPGVFSDPVTYPAQQEDISARQTVQEDEAEDWNLILVNPWNPLPEDYAIELTAVNREHSVDARCYDALQEMLSDCSAAGLSPIICSSYRSLDKQKTLYNNKVCRLMAEGCSREEAEAEAATVVAYPGTSEHQLGLAVDIVDKSNQRLDAAQEDTPVQQWLMEHSWEYGFILRYPAGKSDITGIIYEPWHYRYVGREAAEEIYFSGVCLEEYLEALALEE